jgi:hypothetical protein
MLQKYGMFTVFNGRDSEMIWSIDDVEVHRKTKDIDNAYPDSC